MEPFHKRSSCVQTIVKHIFPSHSFRLGDDPWVNTRTEGVLSPPQQHGKNVKFTREDAKEISLAFWDSAKRNPHHNPGDKAGTGTPQNNTEQHVATRAGPSPKPPEKRDPKKVEDRNKRHSISIPYLSGVLERFRRILQKHDIPVQFKTLHHPQTQRLVHLKDKTPRHKRTYRARRNATNWTLEKLSSPSINTWPNTDVPLPLDKIQQDTYT